MRCTLKAWLIPLVALAACGARPAQAGAITWSIDSEATAKVSITGAATVYVEGHQMASNATSYDLQDDGEDVYGDAYGAPSPGIGNGYATTNASPGAKRAITWTITWTPDPLLPSDPPPAALNVGVTTDWSESTWAYAPYAGLSGSADTLITAEKWSEDNLLMAPTSRNDSATGPDSNVHTHSFEGSDTRVESVNFSSGSAQVSQTIGAGWQAQASFDGGPIGGSSHAFASINSYLSAIVIPD